MLYCRFPLATYFAHNSVNMSNPDDLDGWDWGEEGRSQREGIYVYISLIHFIAQQKVTQHCKAIVLQFKIKREREHSWVGNCTADL